MTITLTAAQRTRWALRTVDPDKHLAHLVANFGEAVAREKVAEQLAFAEALYAAGERTPYAERKAAADARLAEDNRLGKVAFDAAFLAVFGGTVVLASADGLSAADQSKWEAAIRAGRFADAQARAQYRDGLRAVP